MVAAAALRLPTLAVQHYWADEAVTAGLVHLPMGQMLQTIPATESTPPLYYVLAWGWTRVFGSGEFGLRSLSAMAGIAAIPVIYAAARELVSGRAALLAALLAAVSPALVWYSQEARAYGLLVLFSALSLWFFARSLRAPTVGNLVLWSVACILALATHYFAAFVILPEVVWLVVRSPRRGVLASTPVVMVAAALVPLAVHQKDQAHLSFIGSTGLGARLFDTAKVFAAGQTGPRVPVLAAAGVVLWGLALAFLIGTPPAQRRRLAPLVVVSVAGVAVPVLLALVGEDYILARNLLGLWAPVGILAAAALSLASHRWWGRIDAGALVVLSVALCVAVPLTAKLRREAINAQLSSLPGENAAVDIDFIWVPAAATRSAAGTCPSGYRPRLHEVQVVGRARVPSAIRSRRTEHGWWARISNPTSHRLTFQLTVVCLPEPAGASRRVQPAKSKTKTQA
jgi:mannosyltransferase